MTPARQCGTRLSKAMLSLSHRSRRVVVKIPPTLPRTSLDLAQVRSALEQDHSLLEMSYISTVQALRAIRLRRRSHQPLHLVLHRLRLTELRHLRHPRTLTGHEIVGLHLRTLPPRPSSTLPHPPSPPRRRLSLLPALVTRRHRHLSPPRAHDTAPSLRRSALLPLVIPQRAPHSVQPLRGTRPQVPRSVLHPRAVSYIYVLPEHQLI